ncbi:MAG: hypothetical protein U0R80_13825 [Nocardioidaceae bacterium]
MSSATPAHRPSRAVVLGGSLAGLLAARVLSEHVDEVVVVDRDDLDTDLEAPRRGVPQGRHTHGLLVRGAEAMEAILPGLGDGVVARGGRRADIMLGTRWVLQDNLLAQGETGLVGMLCSRVLLEAEVRRRVAATPGVRFVGRHDVVGLLASPDRTRVTGARVAHRETGGEPAFVDLEAEVVVDATGRGSRASRWLGELGFEEPEVTTVEAGLSYVTRLFLARPGLLEDLDADVVGTRPPHGRSGVALRLEGDLWTVTLAGQAGECPPADLNGFLDYARSLPTPHLAEIIEGCEPAGEPMHYRFPGSRWVRWEKLSRRPEGLVVIGDAVCSFNPVYGQGMSSAAHQALRLRELLADGGTQRLARRTATAFAAVAATPWALATGSDRRFPGQDRKPLPERVLDRYVDRLLVVASVDRGVTLAFARVLNLLAPPPSLLAPRVAWKVLGPGSGRVVRAARERRTAQATRAGSGARESQPAVAG